MDAGPTLELINIDDDLAALALRGMLECWGVRVGLHHVATSAQLVALLDGSTPLAPYVVLMCHGVEDGLALPALAPAIAAAQPYNDAVSAQDFAAFLRLPPSVIVNTGCSLGTPAFAEAFLGAGCRAYIGAVDDPDGGDALFYVTHLCYELFGRGTQLPVAHERAAAHTADTRMFRLYPRAVD